MNSGGENDNGNGKGKMRWSNCMSYCIIYMQYNVQYEFGIAFDRSDDVVLCFVDEWNVHLIFDMN